MPRILASCGVTAVLAAASVGVTAPAFAVPDSPCVTDCTVTFMPALGQTTWTVPDQAFDVTLSVAGGAGASYEAGRGGPGGAGGSVTTNVDRAYDGQVLHVLAGAAGTSNPDSPPFGGGGSGSYVASAAGFIAVAGGGGGGGLQVTGPLDPMSAIRVQSSSLPLTGGAGGYSSDSPNGGNGSDSNDALAYGTGATGPIPGSGSWSPATTPSRSVWYGDSGTVASVASDGTITPGLGGLSGRSGGSYSGAADGGGGYAGGGAGTDVVQNDTVTNTMTMTPGPGGGGSGFLAAGLTALSAAPNLGDGSVTITYSINAPATVPGAPTGFTATPDPWSGGAVLTWTAPTDDGGASVIGYVLQRSTDGATWADDGSPFSTTFTDYGLQIGTRYYYRIASENSAGVGAYSTPVSMVSQTYPAYVSDLRADSGNTTATISWGYPADDGGTPVTGYELQYQANDGSGSPLDLPADGWTTASDHATSPFTQTGLTNNTLYEFRIRPVNAQGPSRDWNYVEAVPSAPNFQFSPVVTTTGGAPLNNGSLQPGSSFIVTQSALPVGATLTVTLRGGPVTEPLAAQSLARISLAAPPAPITRTLGTATVGDNGELRFASSLPTDLVPGSYALTSELTNAGRDVLPYTVYFTIPAATTTDPGPGTGAGAGLPIGGSSAPASSATDVAALPESLARTGSSYPGWIVPGGILLIVAGIGLRVGARRRRSA